jgi:hypothetical protein
MRLKRFPDKPHRMSQDNLDKLDEEGGWLATAKGDGWRCELIHTKEGEFVAVSRHDKRLDDLSDFDSRIIEAFKALNTPPDTVIDTEWLRRRAGHASGASGCVVFGILRWGGKWLHRKTESERWEMTKNLPLDGEFLRLAEFADHGFREFFETLRDDPVRGELNEGIVLKHEKSRLVLDMKESKKNQLWVKIKWRDGADGQSETY